MFPNAAKMRFMDLSHTAEYTPRADHYSMTALLRSTVIYHTQLGNADERDQSQERPLMPLDMFAVQGVAVPSLVCDSGNKEAIDQAAPIAAALAPGALTWRQAQAISGNMMHNAALGSVLGFRRMRCPKI